MRGFDRPTVKPKTYQTYERTRLGVVAVRATDVVQLYSLVQDCLRSESETALLPVQAFVNPTA